MKIQKSKIDWIEMLDVLNHKEYYLLSVMYYKDDVDASDSVYITESGLGRDAYRNAKNGLIDNGVLKVVQTSRYKYKYILGKSNVDKDKDKYEYKELYESMIENAMILNGRELDTREIEEIRRDVRDILDTRKEARELEEIRIG